MLLRLHAALLILTALSRAAFAQNTGTEQGSCYNTVVPSNNIQYTVSEGFSRVTLSFVVTPPAGTTFFAIRLNNVFGNNPNWIVSATPQGEFQRSSSQEGGPHFIWPVNGTQAQLFSLTIPGGQKYGSQSPSLSDLCQQNVNALGSNGSLAFVQAAYGNGSAGSCVVFVGSDTSCTVSTVADKSGYRAQFYPTATYVQAPNGAPTLSPNSFSVYALSPDASSPTQGVAFPPQESYAQSPIIVVAAPPPPASGPSLGPAQEQAQPPTSSVTGVPILTQTPELAPSQLPPATGGAQVPAATQVASEPPAAVSVPGSPQGALASPLTPSGTGGSAPEQAAQAPTAVTTPSTVSSAGSPTGASQSPQAGISENPPPAPATTPAIESATTIPGIAADPPAPAVVPPTGPPEGLNSPSAAEGPVQASPSQSVTGSGVPIQTESPQSSTAQPPQTGPLTHPLPPLGSPQLSPQQGPLAAETPSQSMGTPTQTVAYLQSDPLAPLPVQGTFPGPVPSQQDSSSPTSPQGSLTPSQETISPPPPSGSLPPSSPIRVIQPDSPPQPTPQASNVPNPPPPSTPSGAITAGGGTSGTPVPGGSGSGSGSASGASTPPSPSTGSAVASTSPPGTSQSGGCQAWYGISASWSANGEYLASLNLYLQNSGTQPIQVPLSLQFSNPQWSGFMSPWNIEVSSTGSTVSGTVPASATGGQPLLPNNANTANVGGIAVGMNATPRGPTSLTINGIQCTVSG